MQKYTKGFEEKMKPRMNHTSGEFKPVEPFKDAQQALRKATFVKAEREQFFNAAYGDILSDLFSAWLMTEPHAQKEREFLYCSAMALGEVKKRLIGIETYGKNMQFIEENAGE